MKRALGFALVAVVVCLLAMQLYRPARTNPPVDETMTLGRRLDVAAPVDALLTRSCLDCHSNKTRWPWYSNVAPVSWLVISDVSKARNHVNFSEWGSYEPAEQMHWLDKMCVMAREERMPLPSYRFIHRGTALSAGDIKMLCDWTKATREKIEAKMQDAAD
ncbi:MAG TPA: heme-binding domain-containing protein [Candidatus Polarisedimenticolia bacterium]|nr:heme-binding domain-containing protein [Candidatus Polarisedimenticolia bacterium]